MSFPPTSSRAHAIQKVLTDVEATFGQLWGEGAIYIPRSSPGLLAKRILGDTCARRLAEIRDAWRIVRRRNEADLLMTSGTLRGVAVACLQTLIPWGRKPHILVDCLWYRSCRKARHFADCLILWVASRSAGRYVVWASHEPEDYSATFGIPHEKFCFVPFFHTLQQYTFEVQHGSYLFAGGNDDRDYPMLIEAVRPLDLPVLIATQRKTPPTSATIPSNVTIRGISHAEFRQAMAAAGIVVVPMDGRVLRSGGQQTCLNAMVMGKPTIAVGRRWAKDLMRDREHGLIVDFGDVTGLRSAIQWILDHPTKAEAMGRRARRMPKDSPFGAVSRRFMRRRSNRCSPRIALSRSTAKACQHEICLLARYFCLLWRPLPSWRVLFALTLS